MHFVTQEYRPENEMNVAPEGLQMGDGHCFRTAHAHFAYVA
jgi:hypothetical protein